MNAPIREKKINEKKLSTGKIVLEGNEYEFPTFVGSENEKAIDVSTLRSKSGYITYDNGYGSTGSTKSAITFLDGEKGILRYRGYDIVDLTENCSFLEVAFLLLYGELPDKNQISKFSQNVKEHTILNEDFRKYFDVWPRSAHPMGTLSAAVAGLCPFYDDSLDPKDPMQVHIATIRLLAKMPTIAAAAYKKSVGQPFVYPKDKYNYVGNFLNMMYSVPTSDYEVDPDMERVLEKLFIIHADHEQNCSTSTVKTIGSAQANLFASISGGISALWGPLHGGANQAVLEMLQSIHNDGGDVDKYVKLAKDKNSGFRLMGFGHRVYKNYDPRATVIKKETDLILKKLKINDPLLEIAKKLEEVALSDSYFVEKKLYPNVDFYSGIIYKAMGFPTDMFTVLFAIGRLPGWIAQWKEMQLDPETRIYRPRQIYLGDGARSFVKIGSRKEAKVDIPLAAGCQNC